MMFNLILILSLLIVLIRCDIEWSPCSSKCRPGYTYRIRSDDQSIELRSCFEQDRACIDNERAKINEQQKIIQEARRQYLSKTLIQVIVLLSLATALTLSISCISFIYLFKGSNSNHPLKTN